MKRIAAPLLIMIVATLAGCIPDPLAVDDIPTLQPRLVISSQVVAGQGLGVLVTRSIGALDAGRGSELEPLLREIAVDDAVVTLEYDGQADTLIHQDYGVYAGTQNIEAGKTYVLHVVSPTWGAVMATAVAPQAVPFESVSAELYKTGYDSLASVKYAIVDPPEKNWYMVNVQKVSATTEIDRYLNPRVFTHLVRDDAFNGKPFEEQFNVIFQNYSLGDSVLVSMSSISEAYFNYLSLRNDSRYSLAGFASEPLNLPTNVQGGYGYFNLHIPDPRIFVLE
jgi:hypothetical protein